MGSSRRIEKCPQSGWGCMGGGATDHHLEDHHYSVQPYHRTVIGVTEIFNIRILNEIWVFTLYNETTRPRNAPRSQQRCPTQQCNQRGSPLSQGRVGQLPPPRPPRPSGIPSRIRALHLIDACAHPWSFHDSDPTKVH